VSRIGYVICNGFGNTTGACIGFTASAGQYLQYLHIAGIQVYGFKYGINLSATGTTGASWINGNWFERLNCVMTSFCANLQTPAGAYVGTQVSQNHFPEMQVEAKSASGIVAIQIAGKSNTLTANEFPGFTAFDEPANAAYIVLGVGSQDTQVSGFLCSGATCGGGTVYSDAGNGDSVTDWYLGGAEIGTYLPFFDSTSTRQGYFLAESYGILESAATHKFYSGNGGLETYGGTDSDQALHMQNLSAPTNPIEFDSPITLPTAPAPGDNSTKVPTTGWVDTAIANAAGAITYPRVVYSAVNQSFPTAGTSFVSMYTGSTEGMYRSCAYVEVAVVGTAGGIQFEVNRTSNGVTRNEWTSATTSVTAIGDSGSTPQCYIFTANAGTTVKFNLFPSTTITGTPTIYYSVTLERLQ
jgi:hypothetical protein